MTSTVAGERGTSDDGGGGRRADRPPFSLSERQTRRALLVLIGAVPFVIAILALIDGWQVLGDNAIIGIRVRNLLSGDLPLTGLPSTGQNFGTGIESNHPGPLALYLLVPFVVVLGSTAGMAFGAAAINSASFVAAAWVGYRRGGVFLTAAIGLVLCVLARGLSPWTLVDPLSSNLGTFPSVAYALLCWAVLAGDRDLLPITVAIGSFTLQAHLTYIAFGAGVTVVLVLGLVIQGVRGRSTRPTGRELIPTGVVAAVLWAPVLIDQFFGSGNLSSIVRTFTEESGDPGSGWGFALERLGRAIAVPPFPAQTVTGLDFLDGPPIWGVLLGLAAVALVAAQVVREVRRGGRRPLSMLLAVLGVVMVVSVYSAAQLPTAATVKAANLRWMWTFGTLWWLMVLWVGVRLALERLPRPRTERIVPVLLGVMVLGLALVVVQAQVRPARDARAFEVAADLHRVAGDLPKGTYRVRFSGNKALLTVGPAFAYALRSEGSIVYVDAGPFGRGYGSGAMYDGQDVDGTYLVVAGHRDEVAIPEGQEIIFQTTYQENGRVVDTFVTGATGTPELDGGTRTGSPDRPGSSEGSRGMDEADRAFCDQTAAINARVQALMETVDPGEGPPTARQLLSVIDGFDLETLDLASMPAELEEPLARLVQGSETLMAELEAAGDAPALEHIPAGSLADLTTVVTHWLRVCSD